ncbi:MAG: LysR family transcriptional regulator [Hyphomicrobiaceae bacterium]
MSKLENIRVLIRTVELGSFSAAGRSMRLSAAVVSHRIRTLEQQLGCRLFNRTTRKMHLTEQGRTFYEHCVEVCEALDRAEASIADKGAAPRGVLKVTAPLGFGRRVIAPLVPRFHASHPEIDVFLRLSDYLVDLFTEAVDVAVRMAPLTDSSLVVRKIADVERTLCAAPSYIDRMGLPKTPADLEKHHCLKLRYPGARQSRWTLIKGKRDFDVSVSGHLDTDDGDILTDWALTGEGIVIKPLFEIAPHIKRGTLVPILTDYAPPPVTLAILHAYSRMVPLKVRTFADAVVDEARAHIRSSLSGLDTNQTRNLKKVRA